MSKPKYHILVIENSKVESLRIRNALEMEGFEVSGVPSGDSESIDLEVALKYFYNIEPDGAVIDLGFETLSDDHYKYLHDIIKKYKKSVQELFEIDPKRFGGWFLATKILEENPDFPIAIFTQFALDPQRWNELQQLAGNKHIPVYYKNEENFKAIGKLVRKLFEVKK